MLDSRQQMLVNRYTRDLEDDIVALVGKALNAMEPVRLYAENGIARIVKNRRNNSDSKLIEATELKGPSDFAVPVIKVENISGELMAIVFGYACHPVVLRDYKWTGDFPEYARQELGKLYPGIPTLFFQGAGADQNPMENHTERWAQQQGQELAFAVERVLKEEMRPLPSRLTTAYSEVKLQLATPPAQKTLAEFADEYSGYRRRWANRMLEKHESGEEFRNSYPYPVQVWQLGDQPIVSLGGELVVDYAIEVKRILGQDTFVLGYSNDVMSYIPSARILREGGYEGARAQMVYGLPATWNADIETIILHEIVNLAGQAGLIIPESSLVGN